MSVHMCLHTRLYVEICRSLVYPICDTTADVNKQMFWKKVGGTVPTPSVIKQAVSIHTKLCKQTRSLLWGVSA